MTLYNLARVTTSTTGTGTITLGSAVNGYLTFALAGVPNGATVSYGIRDGANSEVGRGMYTSAGTLLSRDTVLASTNGGAKISLSGSAEVYITALAEDFLTAPLAASLGGTGIANGANASLALPNAATTITGGGTLALGGFTLTVPATGTAALLATANIFTTTQKILSPAVDQNAAVISDGAANLSNIDIDGFGAVLTIALVDAANLYQLAYINDARGKIANYQDTGNSLFFDHYESDDTYMATNYLVGYGGYAFFPGSSVNSYGIYERDANILALGVLEDFTDPLGNPVPILELDISNNTVNTTGVYQVDGTQVIGPRVIDARIDDTITTGDATTDGVVDAMRDAMLTHGLIAAA